MWTTRGPGIGSGIDRLSLQEPKGLGRAAARAIGAALLVISLLGASGPDRALAHPLDTFGYTSRAVAMGSGLTASAPDHLAAYYNPAGVGGARRSSFAVGMSVHAASLQVNGRDHQVDTLHLWELGLSGPLPLLPAADGWLGYSLAATLPRGAIYELRQPDDQAMGFPLLDARNRRLVVAWCLGLKLLPWLKLGAGATLLPDVRGQVAIDLGDEAGSSSTAIDIDYNWSPRAGVEIDLPWGIGLGLSYRRGHHMELSLPVDVQVAEGFPVSARLAGPAYGTPDLLAAGVAWRSGDTLELAADLSWYGFEGQAQESPTVTILDSSGEASRSFDVRDPGMKDVLSPRAGIEWWPLSWLALRGGYGYHPTPLRAQTGATNMLDADRHVISAGIGLGLALEPGWGPGKLRLDLHLQLQLLEQVAWEKEEIMVGNPGYPNGEAGGSLRSMGLTLRASP